MTHSRGELLPLALVVAWAALSHDLSAQGSLQTAIGNGVGDSFGFSIRTAGDVDGDGIDDFVVGAPGDDTGGDDAGSATVYSGKQGHVLAKMRGQRPKDRFGYAVASAGDVDGDGHADIVVGAPYHEAAHTEAAPDVGAISVFSGKTGRVILDILGDQEGEALGWSICCVGDFDGDGRDDIAAGSPFHDGDKTKDSGRVRVFSGASGKVLFEAKGQAGGDHFGWSLARIPDVTGDRVDELLVGIDGSSWRDKHVGSAHLYTRRRAEPLRTFRTGDHEDYFGASVASAGDVDGDGKDDLLIGAWNALNEDGNRSGVVMVYSGDDGSPLLRVAGTSTHDRFGFSVVGMGDIDGDGLADFAVGAPQDRDRGSGYVRGFSGATGKVLFTLIGEAIGDAFGVAVCCTPDRNEDGRGELVVGAPGLEERGGWQILPRGSR